VRVFPPFDFPLGSLKFDFNSWGRGFINVSKHLFIRYIFEQHLPLPIVSLIDVFLPLLSRNHSFAEQTLSEHLKSIINLTYANKINPYSLTEKTIFES